MALCVYQALCINNWRRQGIDELEHRRWTERQGAACGRPSLLSRNMEMGFFIQRAICVGSTLKPTAVL